MIGSIFLLVACSKDDSDSKKQEQQNSKSTEKVEKKASQEDSTGGTVIGAMAQAPRGMFNPLFYEEMYEKNIIDFIYESLVIQNEQLEYVPHLATKWKANKDQTALTFELAKNVKWHDGKPFTAHDVVFTYQLLADPKYTEAGGIRTTYVYSLLGYDHYQSGNDETFQGVTADDDYTVTFKFAESTINPLQIASFPIIPKHIFEDIPIEDIPTVPESLQPKHIVGTGPFSFESMQEGEVYTLTRFDDYWQGTPHLDTIEWKVIPKNVLGDLLKLGDIDFVSEPHGLPLEDIEKVKEKNMFTFIEQPSFHYYYLGFKHAFRSKNDVENSLLEPDNWVKHDKLADKKLRQAIALSIDRQQIIDTLLQGHGEIIHTPIAKQMWAYDETTKLAFNPKKAESLLAELGYKKKNKDGYFEDESGNELILQLHYPASSKNNLRDKIAEMIEEMLQHTGIHVKVRESKEMALFMEDISSDVNMDMFLLNGSLNQTDPDPSDFWSARSIYNFSRWNHADADKLLKEAKKGPKALKQDYRKKKYAAWQKIFVEELPVLPLYVPNKIWAHHNRLQGVSPLPHTMHHHAHLWSVED